MVATWRIPQLRCDFCSQGPHISRLCFTGERAPKPLEPWISSCTAGPSSGWAKKRLSNIRKRRRERWQSSYSIPSSAVVGTHFAWHFLGLVSRGPKARADASAKQIECPSRRWDTSMTFIIVTTVILTVRFMGWRSISYIEKTAPF